MSTRTRIGKRVLFGGLLFLSLVCFCSGGVLAKIPEPDNIVYGVAGDGAVTVQLKVGGEEICSYTMGDNPEAGVFYVLRVPMDSLDPIQPGTARPGDTALVYINDAEAEGVWVTLEGRGFIHRVDLGTTDEDDDDVPDQWEQQIVDGNPGDEITSAAQVDPAADFDNDGFSNLREYLCGSHPVDTERIPRCLADLFLDGDVDGKDLVIFTEEYEDYFGLYCPECTFDMDGDGEITGWDFLFFTEDFGRTNCY